MRNRKIKIPPGGVTLRSKQSESKHLSIKARTLPESLRNLARYGASPLGTVTLSAQQIMELADAAQELADAAGVERYP